eukprot:14088901-Alexandrium_andersonii.AAC.1
MRNWPKRCVTLGLEGSQWPFMKGVGHNVLATHLAVVGESLMAQGALVSRGRELRRCLLYTSDAADDM